MSDFPSQFLKELEIFKDNRIIYINQHDNLNRVDSIENGILKFDLTKNNKFIFLYIHETLTNEKYLDDIYYIIDKYNLDAYISTSTTSTFNRSVHPLTNLIMWKDIKTRSDISWNSSNNMVFSSDNFFYGKVLNDTTKKYKGILSIRKHNNIRDYLFSKNPQIDNGIVRYAEWPINGNEESNDYFELKNNFPTMENLLSEYNRSYFSFVVESEHGTDMNLPTNLTEKTLMAFLTGTIPIVLGGSNYVKELKDMGLYVWNDEFGFGNGDMYSTHSNYKVDKFFTCIENVNKLSLNHAKLYWEKNKNIIQKNYDIISEILFGEITDNISIS